MMREFRVSSRPRSCSLVKDTLQPTDLDQLERYAFDDGDFDD